MPILVKFSTGLTKLGLLPAPEDVIQGKTKGQQLKGKVVS